MSFFGPSYKLCDFKFLGRPFGDRDGYIRAHFWEPLIQKSPSDPELYNNLACALAQTPYPGGGRSVSGWALHHYGEGLKSFETALRLAPKRAEIYYNRGRLLLMTARELRTQSLFRIKKGKQEASCAYERAAQDFTFALNLEPRFPEALVNRGWGRIFTIVDLGLQDAAATDHREQALRDFEVAARIDPTLVAAHLDRVLVLRDLSRAEEARAAADEALRHHPSDHSLQKLLQT